MKEILDTIGTRIKSPLLGYFSLALITVNWDAFLYLWLEEGDISVRIKLFDSYTTYMSLIIYPLLISLFFTLVYPWINFFFLKVVAKPTNLRNIIQAESEHLLLLQKKKLELVRNELFSQKEVNLIEQAKRDQDILQIENDELRDKLKQKVDKLRAEKNNSKDEVLGPKGEQAKKDLIQIYTERAKAETNQHLTKKYWDKAEKLQIELTER